MPVSEPSYVNACRTCGVNIEAYRTEVDRLHAEVERLRAKTVEYVATTGGKRLQFHVVDHGTSLTVYVHDDAS